MSMIEMTLSTIVVFIIILFFAVAGGYMLYKLLKNIVLYLQSKRWMRTEGQILFAGVDSQTSIEVDGPHTTYQAKVIYRYTVSGNTYDHNQIAFNSDLRTENYQKQAEIASQYAPGEAVTVYYNPNHPENAIIERKIFSVLVHIMMVLIFFGISLLIIGVAFGSKLLPGFLSLFSG